MKAGFAQVDITPKRPMPLCGFAARCNADLSGVDDPLHVRALVLEPVCIISYDLLGIGSETASRILAALRDIVSDKLSFILCATHTHSAPAALVLRGCGEMQAYYQDLLVERSVRAVREAIGGARSVSMRAATVALTGHNYSRRRILKDGRVSMAYEPDGEVVRQGPVLSEMTLVRFDGADKRGVGGIVSWPCHPDTVCGPNVSADFPGELCSRLSKKYDMPFMFVQGAGANLNPMFEQMTRGEMLRNVDGLMDAMGEPSWTAPDGHSRVEYAARTVALQYGRPFTVGELREMKDGMAAIARTGDGPDGMMTVLADILNVRPGTRPERKMAMHIAGIIRDWCADLIPRLEANDIEPCSLGVSVLKLGGLVLAFVAAEVFAETAIELREAFRDRRVVVVGCASPLVGYLPTDQAMTDGGYEAQYAYRFYDHPGPFAEGAEKKVTEVLRAMMAGE